MEHDIKCWPEFYEDVESGAKPFELRKNDRDYRVGDTLLIREWLKNLGNYTGRKCRREVTYLISGPAFGLAADYVCMGLRPTPPLHKEEVG